MSWMLTRLNVKAIKSSRCVVSCQDEGKNQEGPRQVGDHRKEAENNEEENYEEEEEEAEDDTAGRDKGTNRRAEM